MLHYVEGGTAYGAFQAQVSELVDPNNTVTIRVRNTTGKTITLIAAQIFSSNSSGISSLNITNSLGVSHLTAPINNNISNRVNTGTIAAGNNTAIANADIYFVFANGGGELGPLVNAQGTVFYTSRFSSL